MQRQLILPNHVMAILPNETEELKFARTNYGNIRYHVNSQDEIIYEHNRVETITSNIKMQKWDGTDLLIKSSVQQRVQYQIIGRLVQGKIIGNIDLPPKIVRKYHDWLYCPTCLFIMETYVSWNFCRDCKTNMRDILYCSQCQKEDKKYMCLKCQVDNRTIEISKSDRMFFSDSSLESFLDCYWNRLVPEIKERGWERQKFKKRHSSFFLHSPYTFQDIRNALFAYTRKQRPRFNERKHVEGEFPSLMQICSLKVVEETLKQQKPKLPEDIFHVNDMELLFNYLKFRVNYKKNYFFSEGDAGRPPSSCCEKLFYDRKII